MNGYLLSYIEKQSEQQQYKTVKNKSQYEKFSKKYLNKIGDLIIFELDSKGQPIKEVMQIYV